MIDRDDDDCAQLKQHLEEISDRAGLITKSRAPSRKWQLVNRLAIEELEAWYFGDWEAVRTAYPRLSDTVTKRQSFRDPDAIAGGTWESFERILRSHGYFKGGLPKIEVARTLGAALDPQSNTSRSFVMFREAVLEAIA